MTATITARIGQKTFDIELPNAEFLSGCMTPHAMEVFENVVRAHGQAEAILRVGHEEIQIEVSGAEHPGGVMGDNLCTAFGHAIREAAFKVLNDVSNYGGAIDYDLLAAETGGGSVPAQVSQQIERKGPVAIPPEYLP